ncbi:MAG: YhbY family RNA-binding protein [Candidatus Odinarchaeia archaeon]
MRRKYKHLRFKKAIKRIIESILLKSFSLPKDDHTLANRLLTIALKLSTRSRIRIPRAYKIFICNKCKRLLIPGRNLRVRIRTTREPHVVYKCLKCGFVKRFNLRRKKEMDKISRIKINEARLGPITFQIGKKGLTREVLNELDKQLKAKEVIKGKVYPSALINISKKKLLETIIEELKVDAADIRGSTIILFRRKPKDFKKNLE